MHNRKKTAVLAALCCLMTVLMAGCVSVGSQKSSEIHFRIHNTVTDRVMGVGASYSIAGEVKGSLAMVTADRSALEDGVVDLVLNSDDIEKKSDLQRFSLDVTVTELDGTEVEVASLAMPVAFGESYDFELNCKDDVYGIWLMD